LTQAAEDFLWYVRGERRLSPQTVSAYKSDLQQWGKAGLNIEARQPPTPQVLAKVQEHKVLSALKPSSKARFVATLRAFVRFRSLSDPKWSQTLEHLPSPKVDDTLPKALSVEQIEQLLDFDPSTYKDRAAGRALRNRALFEVMYAGGLRVSELTALTWRQYSESAGVLKILGKGKKERLVPLTERAQEWLLSYRDQVWTDWAPALPKKFQDAVFVSHLGRPLTRMAVWKLLHQRGLEAGIDDLHPHILRHSFATHLLQGGADVRFVQLLLGHTSLLATSKYLKLSDQELKTLFAELHPLR
jgi:integrase/recombinase XerD